jgi:hypothetical protein
MEAKSGIGKVPLPVSGHSSDFERTLMDLPHARPPIPDLRREGILTSWLSCHEMHEDRVKSQRVKFGDVIVMERRSADKIVRRASLN